VRSQVREYQVSEQLRLLVLGAHPDDAEFHAGGLISQYCRAGHVVKLVSVTNGGAGHHQRSSDELVKLRRQEARAAGELVGAEYVTWDHPDGSLLPSLEVREQVIREIRTFAPDLVLTHRTNDYHPDHRAVGQVVQDASYMVTVPLVCPETPILERDPIVAYMNDHFTRPCSLRPDVIVDITNEIDNVVQMLACHVSQVFEFLPYNRSIPGPVPDGSRERLAWLKSWYGSRVAERNARFAEAVTQWQQLHGYTPASIEVYEISEYASQLTDARKQALFQLPSTPQKATDG